MAEQATERTTIGAPPDLVYETALDIEAYPNPVPPLVEVIKDGSTIRVDPDRVKLKRKTDVVVWVTNGLDLRVEFKKTNPAPGNPFTDLTCRGRFCGVLNPPDVSPNVFAYSVTVDGQTLDPTVEVVP